MQVMIMIATEQIKIYFDTLSEYETFRVRWTRACAVLNNTDDNIRRLEEFENRARILGID